MALAILFSLKTMESLKNGMQPQSVATPLFSMRTEFLVSSQSCRSVDADAWYKRALKVYSQQASASTLRQLGMMPAIIFFLLLVFRHEPYSVRHGNFV